MYQPPATGAKFTGQESGYLNGKYDSVQSVSERELHEIRATVLFPKLLDRLDGTKWSELTYKEKDELSKPILDALGLAKNSSLGIGDARRGGVPVDVYGSGGVQLLSCIVTGSSIRAYERNYDPQPAPVPRAGEGPAKTPSLAIYELVAETVQLGDASKAVSATTLAPGTNRGWNIAFYDNRKLLHPEDLKGAVPTPESVAPARASILKAAGFEDSPEYQVTASIDWNTTEVVISRGGIEEQIATFRAPSSGRPLQISSLLNLNEEQLETKLAAIEAPQERTLSSVLEAAAEVIAHSRGLIIRQASDTWDGLSRLPPASEAALRDILQTPEDASFRVAYNTFDETISIEVTHEGELVSGFDWSGRAPSAMTKVHMAEYSEISVGAPKR